MHLTTKGRFAVTAMLDVALNGAPGPVTLAAISERQKISLSYLEQLFGKLRRRGLVDSVRGPGGGYRLAREGQTITVADIIVAVDEPLDAAPASAGDRDDRGAMTADLWDGLTAHLFGYLRSITLADLVRRQGRSPAVTAAPGRRLDAAPETDESGPHAPVTTV